MGSKTLLLFFITIMFSSCQNISQSTTLNSETKSKMNWIKRIGKPRHGYTGEN